VAPLVLSPGSSWATGDEAETGIRTGKGNGNGVGSETGKQPLVGWPLTHLAIVSIIVVVVDVVICALKVIKRITSVVAKFSNYIE